MGFKNMSSESIELGLENSTLMYPGDSVNETDNPLYELPIDMQFNAGHRLAIAVYSILMIISAIGNVYVVILIGRVRNRQGHFTPMNLLLSHLATADLLVTFLMMPIEIAWNTTVTWNAGDFLCRLCSFCRIFGLYLSGFILMCISLDRYYAVVYPLSITQSSERCRSMVITAWVFSFLCSLPQSVIFHVEKHPVFQWYEQCVTFNSFPSQGWELFYNYFGFVCLYGLPFLTIIICYVRIIWTIWKVNSQKKELENQLRRSTLGSFERAKYRSLKMTLVIVSTFCLCWTPYNVMSLWYWLDSESAALVDQRVQKGLFLFACTNSCVNPLIYGVFHFRRKHQLSRVNGTVTHVDGLMEQNKSLSEHTSKSAEIIPMK